MSLEWTDFEELAATKRAGVDAARQANLWDGMVRVLTQLYPDNAHFIYELLQNADDAKASHVIFKLTNESLVFEHNGSKIFSFKDVESIISIGDSTKTTSETEIGKFGVGFKAVFAYTQTPEVHSGKYNFRIRDLVVPELLPASPIGIDGFDTRFTFPFDHPKKSDREATLEIAGALQALGDATLLFLTNIERISYVLPDRSVGRLERVLPAEMQQAGSAGEHIQVTVNSPAGEFRLSHWLRYRKTVLVEDESALKSCAVAVAFCLEEEEGQTKKSKWKIIPLSPGRVCIYFPAEKETSNLRFHLHAPFASTVARDSVIESKGNDQLLAALAGLVAASIVDIRDRGLLNTAFLNVLPIEDDSIPAFYQPIMERLIGVFKTSSLVPTRYAEHRAGKDLFRGPSEIINVISDEDLAFLTQGRWENVAWCANATQANQRATKFLNSLEIDEWSWRELCSFLNNQNYVLESADNHHPPQLSSWLLDKEDSWLRRFYSLLYVATEERSHYLNMRDLSFIRIERGGSFYLVKPAEAYFPINLEDPPLEGVLFVKPETYLAEKQGAQSGNARHFLESAGVRVFDEAAEIERLITTYQADSYPVLELHLMHMKRFLDFFKKRPDRLDVFKKKAIFVGQRNHSGQDMKLSWTTLRNLYLDSPFEETGLAGTSVVKGKGVLWSGYEKISARQEFVNFVKALDIQFKLEIIRTDIWKNPNKSTLSQDYGYGVRESNNSKNEDWTIVDIEALIGNPTIENSLLLWSTLTRADSAVAIASYRPNQQYHIRRADSQLVHYLKNSAWIPDNEGTFHFPKDIGRGQLLPEFVYDDKNGLLTKIGFEASIQRKTEEYQRIDVAAKELGFDGSDEASDIAKAMRESGTDSKALVELLKKNSIKPELPEEEVRNPVRRKSGVLEHRDNAPTKESVKRERSIQPNVQNVVAQAKAYLRAKYTNSHGQMFCQVCTNEMPFRLGTGEYYFEAVQAIRGLAQHFYENRLALCPNCAAMFQFARTCTDADLKKRVQTIDAETVGLAVVLNVELAGSMRKIRFIGTHFFDLSVVLEGA